MTDEELAEKEYENCKFEKVEHYCDKAIFVTGFLAGLKAGRPQWHDLRKDPNDLPEKMGLGSKEVYVAYKDGVSDFAYYRFDKKYWKRSEDEEPAENVIAWCELPTFDKE